MKPAAAAALILGVMVCGKAAPAAKLWSTDNSYLGRGLFFGPGAFPEASKLFPIVVRNLAFHSDRDFVTPFANNLASPPNALGPDGEELDGTLADGSLINENVELGHFSIGGVTLSPFVADTGRLEGEQVSVTSIDGNVTMTTDLVLDMGIGSRGIIKLPFYGTTGTVTVPHSLQTMAGETGIDQAGPIGSGQTIAGRVGDFNGDSYIDGTIVAAGNLPVTSPFYPGQPYALTFNFETDISLDGAVMGSAERTHEAYVKSAGTEAK